MYSCNSNSDFWFQNHYVTATVLNDGFVLNLGNIPKIWLFSLWWTIFYCQLSFESKHGWSFIYVLSSNNKVYLCTFVFHVGIPFCFCVLFRSLMYMFQILCLSFFILVLNYCACNFDRNGWIVGLRPSLPLVVTDERITRELLVKVNCWIKNWSVLSWVVTPWICIITLLNWYSLLDCLSAHWWNPF